jgi:hypothetical protein
MFFTLLLGLSALLIAGSAAYFSVLGIATLFAGSYFQVMFMASSLELGKLIATSYLYRYWTNTGWWLKLYLITSVVVLMFITSLGIFGYLSAAYQVNSSKFAQIDQQVAVIKSQNNLLTTEVDQNTKRIEMLNKVREDQERRVEQAGNYKLPREQAYAAIDKANQEIQKLTERNQALQTEKFNKDAEVIKITSETAKVKDIGTFKFIAETLNQPLDKIVIAFICILIGVFDPLAVSLVLAFNVARYGSTLKPTTKTEEANLKEELTVSNITEDSSIVSQEEPIDQNQASSNFQVPEETPTPRIRHIGFNL